MEEYKFWLWLGAAGMAFGTLIIAMIGRSMRKEDQHHVVLAASITIIATTAYLALATGLGDVMSHDRIVQGARYADWIITTPLLLISLLLVGLPKSSKSEGRLGLMTSIVGLNIYMIATGFIAELADGNAKWLWYVMSSLAFLAITYMLFTSVLNRAKQYAKKAASQYQLLATFLAVMWVCYPVVWFVGSAGTGTISFSSENAIYAVLDLTAKVGFGVALLLGVKQVQRAVKPKKGIGTIESAALSKR